METFSAYLAFFAENSPVPMNSPHKGQWRGALVFSLICVWLNSWLNNREVGDLRRHRGHYDVNVMSGSRCVIQWQNITYENNNEETFISSHYFILCWVIVNWKLKNKLQLNSNQNTNIFFRKRLFEKVLCAMAAILPTSICLNSRTSRWLSAVLKYLQCVSSGDTTINIIIIIIIIMYARGCWVHSLSEMWHLWLLCYA